MKLGEKNHQKKDDVKATGTYLEERVLLLILELVRPEDAEAALGLLVG